MTKYVVANWKANKSLSEAECWFSDFFQLYRPSPQLKVIIAVPATYLFPLWQMLKQNSTGLSMAIQDLSAFPLGSYTGEVAADMVRDIVDFAVLGHSERRRYFHETNQDVANKVSEALMAEIEPIVCVDLSYASSQLAALEATDLKRVIIGYGPVEAAGIYRPQSVETVSKAVKEIQILNADAPILYGGSINAENASTYMNIQGVAGLMIGKSSLNVEEFARICAIVAEQE